MEGKRTIFLHQSEYASFTEGEFELFTIESGRAELYVCSQSSCACQRLFLMELGAGDTFFRPKDLLYALGFQLFALEDVTIKANDAPCPDLEAFKQGATSWFYKLSLIPWVRVFAGIDDDSALIWNKKLLFAPEEAACFEDIQELIFKNQEIFSVLVFAKFHAEEQRLTEKKKKREKMRKHLTTGITENILLGQTDEETLPVLVDELDDHVLFSVRKVALHLKMSADKIGLASELSAGMDSISKMRRLVKKANMQIRLVALEQGWQQSDCGAIVACKKDGKEFVALLPDGSGYKLYDVKHPHGLVVNTNVASQLSKDAFVCYPGFSETQLGVCDMLRFMLRHTAEKDWKMVWLISCIAGIVPLLLPVITESVFQDILPIFDRKGLATVVQVLLVSGFATAMFQLSRSISFIRIKSQAHVALEAALWSRLLALPAVFFRRYQVGDLFTRMQSASQAVSLLDNAALSLLFDSLFSFFSLLLMFYYSAKLTLIALAGWLIYLLVFFLLFKKMLYCQDQKLKTGRTTSAMTFQLLNGITKFKIRGSERQAFFLWSKFFGEEWFWNMKVRWCQNWFMFVNIAQNLLFTMALYCIAMGTFGDSSTQSVGTAPLMGYATFLGFQTAFAAFNATLGSFMQQFLTISPLVSGIKSIQPILETVPEVTPDKIEVGQLKGMIEAKKVSFSYGPDMPTVLRDISFTINPGESVAFVGTSGCGKSTLVRLLLGFETPKSGAIYYDGQDLETLDLASVRSRMGVVLQNAQLLSGDIFSNIVGTLPLSIDDAWEAAKMVGLAADIEQMPMGMHTIIAEGAGNISHGQRQRILLARSIVHRPELIIMDEATSALDNVTQAVVTQSLKKLRATRIIIAHRLSTIQDADTIFVMDAGRIVEQGTFAQLMQKNGLFTNLAKRQLE